MAIYGLCVEREATMSGTVRWQGSDLLIDFNRAVTISLVDAVVDVDDFGEVLGIEVLGLLATHPGLARAELDQSTYPYVASDADADAVYIRLGQGRSRDQVVTVAAIAFDQSDHIAAIAVRMES